VHAPAYQIDGLWPGPVKKSLKRISLRPETVRNLQPLELSRARGGMIECTGSCGQCDTIAPWCVLTDSTTM
jgi:hypothetical protein